MAIHIFDIETDGVNTPMISKDARLIIGPHNGAEIATMNYVVLEPGEQNQAHSHTDSEDTIFILKGEGKAVDLTNNITQSIEAGCVVHVPAGIEHKIQSTGSTPMISVGGPCPPDFAMLKRSGVNMDFLLESTRKDKS